MTMWKYGGFTSQGSFDDVTNKVVTYKDLLNADDAFQELALPLPEPTQNKLATEIINAFYKWCTNDQWNVVASEILHDRNDPTAISDAIARHYPEFWASEAGVAILAQRFVEATRPVTIDAKKAIRIQDLICQQHIAFEPRQMIKTTP